MSSSTEQSRILKGIINPKVKPHPKTTCHLFLLPFELHVHPPAPFQILTRPPIINLQLHQLYVPNPHLDPATFILCLHPLYLTLQNQDYLCPPTPFMLKLLPNQQPELIGSYVLIPLSGYTAPQVATSVYYS